MTSENRKISPVKIILDIIMIALLVITCGTNFMSTGLRNIGGFTLLALLIVHMIMGLASGRASQKNLGFRTVLSRIIDTLLLISVIVLVVSGLFTSRMFFNGISSNFFYWQIAHNFFAALAIILAGIHTGLQWSGILDFFGRFVKLPAVAARTLGIILAVVIVLFGSYSVYSSGFSRLLTSPLNISRMSGFRGQGSFNFQSGQFNRNFNNPDQPGAQNGDSPSESDNNNGDFRRFRNRGSQSDGNVQGGQSGEVPGQNGNSDQNRPAFGNRGGAFNRGNFQNGGGFGRRNASSVNVLLSYLSIIGLFAVIAYYIDKPFRRKHLKVELVENEIETVDNDGVL